MFPTVARGNKKKKNDNGQKVTNARTLATETPGYNSNGVSRRDSPLAAFVAASRERPFYGGRLLWRDEVLSSNIELGKYSYY